VTRPALIDKTTRSAGSTGWRERYPKARELTITADGGGSNGTRVRLWKVELIAATTTEAGLKVESALDNRHLRKGYQSQQCPDEDARHPGRRIPS
jgi:Rhodopirellula transposase DDE domain